MTRPSSAILAPILLAILLLAAGPDASLAFMKDGCGSGTCTDCHSLSVEEATKLLKPLEIDRAIEVRESPVKGLWAVEAEKSGARGTVFVDYGKQHVLQAQILRIDTKENVTGVRKVDPSKIPLGNAIRMGKADAKKTVIVFTDPDCHFCGKLHESIKQVIEKDPDVAFRLVVFSRNNDPAVLRKVQAILCSKSAAMLEDAYHGKTVPAPDCASDAAVENGKIAADFGVSGTPAIVFPDGRLIPGTRDADTILRMLKEGEAPPGKPVH